MKPFLIFSGLILFLGFLYILFSYARGLRNSPREIWILFLAKLLEYAAYGGSNMAFVLYLSKDCGLDDVRAGTYIGIWSTLMTCVSMLVGSIVDAIGVKKTLIIGMFAMIVGRFVMPFSSNLLFVTVFAFIPVAIGNAILVPVLSVGIKKYTAAESTSLGFGLFYTLMNVGFAIGGYVFDKTREVYGEHSRIAFLGIEISTYQMIFLISFLLTLPSFILILFMRNNISLNETGQIELKNEITNENKFFESIGAEIKKSFLDTLKIMKIVFLEKAFWTYLFMLGILVFVKLVFYHFNYTFPKYGIRVLGEGSKVGTIYGILNPVLIIFLVPLIAHLTKKIKSYYMLIIGTSISALSIFIAATPDSFWNNMGENWYSNLIYNEWLGLPIDRQNPIILSLVLFIFIFTIGEAIWSPRLMQFSAEIAPIGKEGTYIALSYLPYFLAKMIAGPLSGVLIARYTPEGNSDYPEHYLIWIWIGGITLLSPIGLVLFRRMFQQKH